MELSEKVLETLENQEIDERDFLKITEEKLRSVGLALGPALRLADFAKECKEKKLRSYSSYKTLKHLKEVLSKYGIDSNDISSIPPFIPVTEKIDVNDEEIKRKMYNLRCYILKV